MALNWITPPLGMVLASPNLDELLRFSVPSLPIWALNQRATPFKTMEHGTPIFTSLDIIFGEFSRFSRCWNIKNTRLVSLPRKATKWTEYVPSLLEKEGTMTDERKGNLDRFEHSLPFVFVWHLPLTNPLLICWLKQYDYWFPISSSNPPWIMNLHNPELLVY